MNVFLGMPPPFRPTSGDATVDMTAAVDRTDWNELAAMSEPWDPRDAEWERRVNSTPAADESKPAEAAPAAEALGHLRPRCVVALCAWLSCLARLIR